MTQSSSRQNLDTHRKFIDFKRETFLAQCWEFLGTELEASLAQVPPGENNDDDREASKAIIKCWQIHPEGWRYLNRQHEIPELQNLLGLLDELVRG